MPSQIRPVIVRTRGRGKTGETHFVFVVEQLHQYLPPGIAEEYELQVGCHRRDAVVLPSQVELLNIYLTTITSLHAQQRKQADKMGIVSETQIGTGLSSSYGQVGTFDNIAQ